MICRERKICRSCDAISWLSMIRETNMNRLPQDSYLADAARAMIAAPARSQSAVEVLQKQCPHIYRQLERLRECRGLLSLWGRSRNVDEYAGLPIVDPAILQAIGQLTNVPMRGQIIHAGLAHTYGYLFSLIETPFGYKHERWTCPTIEDGFGIRSPTLRAEPTAGTLLTNVTWFAGQIAFRDRPRDLRRLQLISDCVSPVAEQYPYSSLNICRIVDEISCRPVQLQTDLVPFPCPPAKPDADNHLLVYSCFDTPAERTRLITVFPVTPDVVCELTAPETQGEVDLEHLPYNAYVRGLSGRTVHARRRWKCREWSMIGCRPPRRKGVIQRNALRPDATWNINQSTNRITTRTGHQLTGYVAVALASKYPFSVGMSRPARAAMTVKTAAALASAKRIHSPMAL
jgi:hypothetical protein